MHGREVAPASGLPRRSDTVLFPGRLRCTHRSPGVRGCIWLRQASPPGRQPAHPGAARGAPWRHVHLHQHRAWHHCLGKTVMCGLKRPWSVRNRIPSKIPNTFLQGLPTRVTPEAPVAPQTAARCPPEGCHKDVGKGHMGAAWHTVGWQPRCGSLGRPRPFHPRVPWCAGQAVGVRDLMASFAPTAPPAEACTPGS